LTDKESLTEKFSGKITKVPKELVYPDTLRGKVWFSVKSFIGTLLGIIFLPLAAVSVLIGALIIIVAVVLIASILVVKVVGIVAIAAVWGLSLIFLFVVPASIYLLATAFKPNIVTNSQLKILEWEEGEED